MEKIWFISVNSKREGPFSFQDLKRDSRITPDILVWREGFSAWKRIGDVPELQGLFKDETEPPSAEIHPRPLAGEVPPQDELAIDTREEPPYLFWALIAIFILTYVLIRLYWK